MPNQSDTMRFHGVYPILTTIFDDSGELDEHGQRRVIDFLLAAGVHGLVTPANASEGYTLTDAERERLIALTLEHVAGRVPVIVAVSHPAAQVAVARSRAAEQAGAAGLLSLPPFYGLWAADGAGVFNYFAALDSSTALPIVVQDHPLAGIPMPAPFLARLATELEHVHYFKIEVPRAPIKMAELRRLAGARVLGMFGGMGGITFFEELERGASGTMPSSAMPDVFCAIYQAFGEGDRERALVLFERYLPLIRFELQLGGKDFQKELLRLGGIIASAHSRGPVPPAWDEAARSEMQALVRRFDLLALR